MGLDRSISERQVQAIWYDRALRPECLETVDGGTVSVIDPGEWNQGEGPDFRNAVIALDGGRTLRGDVEVHLRPSDWFRHGHGGNPLYAHVIAHVVWRADGACPIGPSGAMTIVLGRFAVKTDPEKIDLAEYPFGRPSAGRRACQPSEENVRALAAAVVELGRERLLRKAKAYRRAAGSADDEPTQRQGFYREVMGAFGYGRNAEAFRRVADLVPVSALMAEPENAAWALASAGTFVSWRMSGVRPRNRPWTRLTHAGRLLCQADVLDLRQATDFSRRGCRTIVSRLTRDGHLGRGRAAAIVANVIVPWAIARGRLDDVPEWLPPEDVSEPVRQTVYRLFGCRPDPAAYAHNGLAIQGLLEVRRRWCRRGCGGCGFVKLTAGGGCGRLL